MLRLLLGQLYVGRLWVSFVTVIVQLMCCLVLCSVFAGMYPLKSFGGLPHQDLHAKNCQIGLPQLLKQGKVFPFIVISPHE